MKFTKLGKNIGKKNMQCALCQANFEVWIDNLKADPEREEKMRERLLTYCPACAKERDKN